VSQHIPRRSLKIKTNAFSTKGVFGKDSGFLQNVLCDKSELLREILWLIG
jgi:hypothetical protein